MKRRPLISSFYSLLQKIADFHLENKSAEYFFAALLIGFILTFIQITTSGWVQITLGTVSWIIMTIFIFCAIQTDAIHQGIILAYTDRKRYFLYLAFIFRFFLAYLAGGMAGSLLGKIL